MLFQGSVRIITDDGHGEIARETATMMLDSFQHGFTSAEQCNRWAVAEWQRNIPGARVVANFVPFADCYIPEQWSHNRHYGQPQHNAVCRARASFYAAQNAMAAERDGHDYYAGASQWSAETFARMGAESLNEALCDCVCDQNSERVTV